MAYSARALRQSHVSGKYWRTTGAGRAAEEGSARAPRPSVEGTPTSYSALANMLVAGAAKGTAPFLIIICRPSPGPR